MVVWPNERAAIGTGAFHRFPALSLHDPGVATAPSNTDPWLRRWLPFIRERAGKSPVLELGCGGGKDTATLLEAGFAVVAIDQSSRAIERARRRAPQAQFHAQDLRSPFPAPPGGAGVILASLSLHYFPWHETLALVERIHATLRPAGALLCRLNSTHDHHYGASGHPRIEDNYFLVKGAPKRFFDRATVEVLFAGGWRILSAEECVIDRYALPKVVWELVLERDA